MKFSYFNKLLDFIKEKHHNNFISLEEIYDGGSSYNFCLKTKEDKYFLKLIPQSDEQRIEKTLQLLKCFYGAQIAHPDELKTADAAYCIMAMPYIDGHKLTAKQFTPSLYLQLQNTYQEMMAQSVPEKYVFPQQTLQDLKIKIDDTLRHSKGFAYKLIDILFWRQFRQRLVTLPAKTQVIHGDFTLKNILVDKTGKPHIMDFELVRFGYVTEDWAMLLLQLANFNKLWGNMARLKKDYALMQNLGADNQQWLHGVQMFYLERLRRRLTDVRKKHNLRKNLCFLCSLMRYFAVERLILKQS